MARVNKKVKHQRKLWASDPRPCLQCRTPHSHNNSFCSVKCAEQYKQRKQHEQLR